MALAGELLPGERGEGPPNPNDPSDDSWSMSMCELKLDVLLEKVGSNPATNAALRYAGDENVDIENWARRLEEPGRIKTSTLYIRLVGRAELCIDVFRFRPMSYVTTHVSWLHT